jgi:glycosidase
MYKRLRFFERDTVDWQGVSLAGFYHSMVELKHTQRALTSGVPGGTQHTLSTTGDRVYAFTRTRANNTVLVALNFGDAPMSIAYRGLEQRGAFTDWFTKSKVALGASGSIDVPAHGYRVFVR